MDRPARDLTRRESLRLLGAGFVGLPGVVGGLSRHSFGSDDPGGWSDSLFFNQNIPAEAELQLGRLAPGGIATFSFTPSGGWVITTLDGRRFARNIPDECYEKLKAYLAAGHRIRILAFPPQGGNSWLIVTDRNAKFARNIPSECNTKLNEFVSKGRQIRSVAFPPGGGNSWLVVAEGGFFARNVPDECYQVLRNLSERPRIGVAPPRQVHHVAFAPNGGWLIMAGDYAFSRDAPAGCYDKVRSFQGSNRRVDLIAFTPSSGWSVVSNETIASRPRDEIRSFEGDVRSGSLRQTIWERMRASKVPGVAVACVLENRLAWSCGYGHLRGTSGHAVHPETVFQAASISKVVAAIGAMRLVEYGRVNLTDDIRDILSWRVPVRIGVRVTTAPTVEHLLSHRAGFNVGGFGGYDTNSDSRVPNLDEILAGTSSRTGVKVNPDKGPIRIVQNPGSYMYSGGGFEVLEKLIEDVSGRHFRQWMDAHVLVPLGMSRSTFELKPAATHFSEAQVATAHSDTGSPHRYTPGLLFPEAAAAGLLTTAEDLARVIMMMNGGGMIGSTRVLQQATVEDMLTARGATREGTFNTIGLGFKLNGARTNASFRYGHGGTNDGGFRGLVFGYPNRRAGVVVLTNGEASDKTSFRRAVADAVVRTYGW